MSTFSYRTKRNGTNERCDVVGMYMVLVLSISLPWGDSTNIKCARFIYLLIAKGWEALRNPEVSDCRRIQVTNFNEHNKNTHVIENQIVR